MAVHRGTGALLELDSCSKSSIPVLAKICHIQPFYGMLERMPSKQVTRNIALTPHFDRFVRSKIDSGRYQSASEVVRESLRVMEQREQDRQEALADVRKKIRVGYEQVLAGDTVDPNKVCTRLKKKRKMSRRAEKTR